MTFERMLDEEFYTRGRILRAVRSAPAIDTPYALSASLGQTRGEVHATPLRATGFLGRGSKGLLDRGGKDDVSDHTGEKDNKEGSKGDRASGGHVEEKEEE